MHNWAKQNIQFRSIVPLFRCYMCHKAFASFRGKIYLSFYLAFFCDRINPDYPFVSIGVRKHFHVHDPAESFVYECELCDRKYSRISVLRKHMKYHEARKRYDKSLDKGRQLCTCPICQKEWVFCHEKLLNYDWIVFVVYPSL